MDDETNEISSILNKFRQNANKIILENYENLEKTLERYLDQIKKINSNTNSEVKDKIWTEIKNTLHNIEYFNGSSNFKFEKACDKILNKLNIKNNDKIKEELKLYRKFVRLSNICNILFGQYLDFQIEASDIFININQILIIIKMFKNSWNNMYEILNLKYKIKTNESNNKEFTELYSKFKAISNNSDSLKQIFSNCFKNNLIAKFYNQAYESNITDINSFNTMKLDTFLKCISNLKNNQNLKKDDNLEKNAYYKLLSFIVYLSEQLASVQSIFATVFSEVDQHFTENMSIIDVNTKTANYEVDNLQPSINKLEKNINQLNNIDLTNKHADNILLSNQPSINKLEKNVNQLNNIDLTNKYADNILLSNQPSIDNSSLDNFNSDYSYINSVLKPVKNILKPFNYVFEQFKSVQGNIFNISNNKIDENEKTDSNLSNKPVEISHNSNNDTLQSSIDKLTENINNSTTNDYDSNLDMAEKLFKDLQDIYKNMGSVPVVDANFSSKEVNTSGVSHSRFSGWFNSSNNQNNEIGARLDKIKEFRKTQECVAKKIGQFLDDKILNKLVNDIKKFENKLNSIKSNVALSDNEMDQLKQELDKIRNVIYRTNSLINAYFNENQFKSLESKFQKKIVVDFNYLDKELLKLELNKYGLEGNEIEKFNIEKCDLISRINDFDLSLAGIIQSEHRLKQDDEILSKIVDDRNLSLFSELFNKDRFIKTLNSYIDYTNRLNKFTSDFETIKEEYNKFISNHSVENEKLKQYSNELNIKFERKITTINFKLIEFKELISEKVKELLSVLDKLNDVVNNVTSQPIDIFKNLSLTIEIMKEIFDNDKLKLVFDETKINEVKNQLNKIQKTLDTNKNEYKQLLSDKIDNLNKNLNNMIEQQKAISFKIRDLCEDFDNNIASPVKEVGEFLNNNFIINLFQVFELNVNRQISMYNELNVDETKLEYETFYKHYLEICERDAEFKGLEPKFASLNLGNVELYKKMFNKVKEKFNLTKQNMPVNLYKLLENILHITYDYQCNRKEMNDFEIGTISLSILKIRALILFYIHKGYFNSNDSRTIELNEMIEKITKQLEQSTAFFQKYQKCFADNFNLQSDVVTEILESLEHMSQDTVVNKRDLSEYDFNLSSYMSTLEDLFKMYLYRMDIVTQNNTTVKEKIVNILEKYYTTLSEFDINQIEEFLKDIEIKNKNEYDIVNFFENLNKKYIINVDDINTTLVVSKPKVIQNLSNINSRLDAILNLLEKENKNLNYDLKTDRIKLISEGLITLKSATENCINRCKLDSDKEIQNLIKQIETKFDETQIYSIVNLNRDNYNFEKIDHVKNVEDKYDDEIYYNDSYNIKNNLENVCKNLVGCKIYSSLKILQLRLFHVFNHIYTRKSDMNLKDLLKLNKDVNEIIETFQQNPFNDDECTMSNVMLEEFLRSNINNLIMKWGFYCEECIQILKDSTKVSDKSSLLDIAKQKLLKDFEFQNIFQMEYDLLNINYNKFNELTRFFDNNEICDRIINWYNNGGEVARYTINDFFNAIHIMIDAICLLINATYGELDEQKYDQNSELSLQSKTQIDDLFKKFKDVVEKLRPKVKNVSDRVYNNDKEEEKTQSTSTTSQSNKKDKKKNKRKKKK